MGVRWTSWQILEYILCMESNGRGNKFELIPTVKMETRHPLESYFDNKFPSVCNDCGVMVATGLKSQDLEKVSDFCVLFKTTFYRKIFKILLQQNSSQYRSTCYVQISWHLANGKSVKSWVTYLKRKQNFAWFSSSCYCADCTQNLPGPAPDSVLRLL